MMTYGFILGAYCVGYIWLATSLRRDGERRILRVHWWSYVFLLAYPPVMVGILISEALLRLEKRYRKKA